MTIYIWKCRRKEYELLLLAGKCGIKECESGQYSHSLILHFFLLHSFLSQSFLPLRYVRGRRIFQIVCLSKRFSLCLVFFWQVFLLHNWEFSEMVRDYIIISYSLVIYIQAYVLYWFFVCDADNWLYTFHIFLKSFLLSWKNDL